MANKPDLRPVPYENGSYYRLKDKNLIVVVKNYGKVAAVATTTRVGFAGYGSCKEPQNRGPQDLSTELLGPGVSSVELKFNCPSDDCFDPDCEFYITVDATNEFREDPTTRNNVTFSVCSKPMLPDLGVVLNDKGALGTLENEQLKVVVRNQGTAYARPSKTRVNLNGKDYDKSTPDLEPGYTAEIIFDTKGTAAKAGSQYTISLDVDGVVHVPDESGKHTPHVYHGVIPED